MSRMKGSKVAERTRTQCGRHGAEGSSENTRGDRTVLYICSNLPLRRAREKGRARFKPAAYENHSQPNRVRLDWRDRAQARQRG